MTIRASEYFSFAGIYSTEFNIMNVNVDSGMQEESFVSSRQIKEIKISGRDKPYFQRIEREPLEIKVSFAFEDRFDQDKLRDVARWLCGHEYYQELYFSENPNMRDFKFTGYGVERSKFLNTDNSAIVVDIRLRRVDRVIPLLSH